MPQEAEKPVILVRSLHLDLEVKSLTVHTTDESTTRFTIAPQGVIFEHLPGASDRGSSTPQASPAQQPESAAAERERAITMTGKLKSMPREGRPDSANHPTAWGRFAAHEETPEGVSRAHLYLATFHGETRAIALRLGIGTQLEVKGFPRPAQQQGKLDGFSVVDIVRIGEPPPQRST